MPPEVVSAIISAVAVVIAALVPLIVTIRQVRIEREKLQFEKDRYKTDIREKDKKIKLLEAEAETYRTDLEQLSKLVPKDDSSKKLLISMQIRDLLTIFEQSSITSVNDKDPIDVFRSIRKTRILLDERGLLLINDSKIKECIRQIKQLLHDIEAQVRDRCPQLIKLVVGIENQSLNVETERLKLISELSNVMSCVEVNKFIEKKHSEILIQIRKIKKLFHELDNS